MIKSASTFCDASLIRPVTSHLPLPEVVVSPYSVSSRPRVDDPVLLLKAIEARGAPIATFQIRLPFPGQGLEMNLVSCCLIEFYGFAQSGFTGNKLSRPALPFEFLLSIRGSSHRIHRCGPSLPSYLPFDSSFLWRSILYQIPWSFRREVVAFCHPVLFI